MTGILNKMARGAATAGAQLSAENHRANLDAIKEKRMQTYQTSERIAGQEHDINMQKLQNDGRVGAGATQGDIQLMEYFQQHGIAKTPEEAYNRVREINTDPQKVIMDIAKSMQEADSEYDRKPFGEYVKTAETEVNALRERLNPKPKEPGAPVKDAKPKGILNQNMGGSMIDQAMDSALASGAGDPGAQPAAQSASASLPAVNQRKVGQEYDTPRGRAIWRDGGWELLNAAQ